MALYIQPSLVHTAQRHTSMSVSVEMQCRRQVVSSFAHHPLYFRAVGERPSCASALVSSRLARSCSRHEASHVFGRVSILVRSSCERMPRFLLQTAAPPGQASSAVYRRHPSSDGDVCCVAHICTRQRRGLANHLYYERRCQDGRPRKTIAVAAPGESVSVQWLQQHKQVWLHFEEKWSPGCRTVDRGSSEHLARANDLASRTTVWMKSLVDTAPRKVAVAVARW